MTKGANNSLIDDDFGMMYVIHDYWGAVMVWSLVPELKRVAIFRVKWYKRREDERRYYPFFNSRPRGPWSNPVRTTI